MRLSKGIRLYNSRKLPTRLDLFTSLAFGAGAAKAPAHSAATNTGALNFIVVDGCTAGFRVRRKTSVMILSQLNGILGIA